MVELPEQMQALLIKEEAEVAVLPMISAVNLYNKGVDLRLQGCPVWGTLYLASRLNLKELPPNSPVYLFGTGTTPDLLARHYFSLHPLPSGGQPSYNYVFPTARELMLALLGGRAQTAVLPEPFLSVALSKDTSLHIVADLNRPTGKTAGYPQTAVVLLRGMEKYRAELDALLDASCRFASAHPQEAIRLLEERKIFPPGMLTPEGIGRCKIAYRPAYGIRKEVDRFLRIIYDYEPKALGGRLPDSSFIPTHRL